ncbi:hypothetical protein PsorP6_016474 [Peronosclerospora sorghi]|uniref:Uncharacterized protein n=1 Tax=Peronosclerospora sorghi TaxID=230839 RepID=A0ACC0VPX5_9STRA|nr:hypothetical protein PsorP6_016474 [Peronosclerospora sorghi]
MPTLRQDQRGMWWRTFEQIQYEEFTIFPLMRLVEMLPEQLGFEKYDSAGIYGVKQQEEI